MTLWQIRLISVLCVILTALVTPAIAGDPENKKLMDGYVRAASARPEDRYAWLRLAKVFRARDQYGDALVNQYELRHKEQGTEQRLFNVRPVVPVSYRYCQAHQFYSVVGDHRPIQPLGQLFMQSDDDNRIIHVDLSINAKIGPEDSFLPGYRPAYADFETAYGRAVARLKVIESARQRKDSAWKDIETSDCDGAAMWLNLGLACESCRADEGEAALQVALLSNPNKSEAELARLALARIWASEVRRWHAGDYLIAPAGY
jgi:hypothetical protein